MIPITFRHDDENNPKKGNIQAQDLASFFSVSMPKEAGILDIFDNPCSVYQVNYTTTGYATLTLHKGYINIFGRCIYVEEGEQVQVALPTSGSVTGNFGIRVNLGQTGADEVTWFAKTGNVVQENLLNNELTGIYEFVLYSYTATSTSFTLGNKTTAIIVNINDYLKGANFETKSLDNETNSIATTKFVKEKIDNVLGFAKTTGSNLAEASNGRKNEHYFTVLDFLGTRMIYGTVNALEANTPTTVTWGSNLLKASSLDKAVFIPSFTTQTRSNPNDRGMDEPCHIMKVGVNGFVIYNSNGYTVTGTYLVIGEKP